MLLPMMLRELSGALATMADGPYDDRKNSLELLNNILECLSRGSMVSTNTQSLCRLCYTSNPGTRLQICTDLNRILSTVVSHTVLLPCLCYFTPFLRRLSEKFSLVCMQSFQ